MQLGGHEKRVCKTSVVITTHNYGIYLKECIESVLDQTCKPLEIIVVDDSSTDDTDVVLEEYKEKVAVLQVFAGNAQIARNTGLAKAEGEYIIFLDADDILNQNFLEKTEEVLDSHSDVSLVYANRKNFGDKEIIKSMSLEEEWTSQSFSYKELSENNYISLPSLIRKEGFRGFDENVKRYQDWDAWITFLKDKKALWLDEELFKVRFHGENKTLKYEGDLAYKIIIYAKHGLNNYLIKEVNHLEAEVKKLRDENLSINEQLVVKNGGRVQKLIGFIENLLGK